MVELKPKVKSENLDGGMEVMARKKEEDEDRAQGEALLRQQIAVARLGQLALTIANLPTLLKEATVLVGETLNVQFAQVWKYTKNSQTMRLRGGIDRSENMVKGITIDSKETETEEKLVTKQTKINWSSILEKQGVASSISAVIQIVEENKDRAKVSLWGVLAAHTTEKRNFSKDEIAFLQAIANMLSAAIARARSDERLRLLASAVQYAEDSILITTTELEPPGPEIVFVNSAFTRMTGYIKSH